MHVAAPAGHVIRDATASGGHALTLTGRGAAVLRVRVGAQVDASVRVRAVPCNGGPRVVVTVGETRVLSARVTSRRWITLSATASVLAGRRTLALRVAGTRCRKALRVDRVKLADGARTRTIWVPSPTTTWQWQLSGALDTSVDAQMYDVDLFDTPASVVAELHAQGRRAVCYLSAGSFENGPPGRERVPRGGAGEPLDGCPDERWLDVRRARRARADPRGPDGPLRAKGFDGVEADNVDGYANDDRLPADRGRPAALQPLPRRRRARARALDRAQERPRPGRTSSSPTSTGRSTSSASSTTSATG